MLAAALALAASLTWGLADFFGGVQSRRHALVAVVAVSQTAGLLGLLVLSAVAAGPAPGWEAIWPAVLGGLSGAVAIGAFYRALAVGTMSVVAPIVATSVAVPVLFGLATGERPAAIAAIGMALAVAGIVLAAREPAKPGADAPRGGAVGLAVLAAVMLGGLLVGLDASAERGDALWAVLVARAASCVLCLAVAAAVRPKLDRDAVPALIGLGLLDTSANALFAAASTEGLLAVVAVLSSLYPVVTVVLAGVLLHERLAAAQQAGVAGALVGVVLIAAA